MLLLSLRALLKSVLRVGISVNIPSVKMDYQMEWCKIEFYFWSYEIQRAVTLNLETQLN